MIRLGLRLTVAGGREALVRLAVTAAAVALGAGMLLLSLAGINAVHAQNARYAWLNTGAGQHLDAGPATVEPLWWHAKEDEYQGQDLGVIQVAGTGPQSRVPPGIAKLPGPGEFYASPALSRLLQSTPAAQLGDRFPGRLVGTIRASALPAPNSLIVVLGRTPAQMARTPGAKQVSAIRTTEPSDCPACNVGMNANAMDLTLGVVACALFFPILVFIGAATRLSTARREQRFAAMRLVGATPGQTVIIAAVESTVAAVAGVAGGFGVYYALRIPLSGVPFTGEPFFPSDLSLSIPDVLVVALGIPVAAAVAARLALRRVRTSPLGVTRRVTPKPPRAWRIVPLLAGIAELAYWVHAGAPEGSGRQTEAFLPGFLIVMAGLVIAGPWLTMVGSRIVAGRARRPAALIAGRRLGEDPRAAFRAIAGLVLALFVTSVAVAVITPIAVNRAGLRGSAARHTLEQDFFGGPDTAFRNSVPSIPEGLPAQLASIAGVQGVSVVHVDPSTGDPPSRVVSCAQLATTAVQGRCAAGAAVAALPPFFGSASTQRKGWSASPMSLATLQSLPVQAIYVATDGSAAALEQARTVLENAFPQALVPTSVSETSAQTARVVSAWQHLAEVVILVSLPIAGCSLAVSVAAGLNDRKRPFSLLRLTGAPFGTLRRVVTLEAAVPLLVGAVLATAAGFLAAGLFLRAQLGYSLQAPGTAYYVTVLLGMAGALGVIASTLPLLRRTTGPETARNE